MPQEFNWDPPPLAPDDQRLIDAYLRVGVAVDELAYTPQFEEVVRSSGRPVTRDEMHSAYKRLLSLRKMGRLPRRADSIAAL